MKIYFSMKILSLLILAFAVSIDSFGVGTTYGLRKVRIPFGSLLTITLCSAGMILFASAVARSLQLFISPPGAKSLGGVILMGLGLWALLKLHKSLDQPRSDLTHEDHADPSRTGNPGGLGLILNILRTPMVADMDASGHISGVEALVLGIALSLDAFGAGVSAALLGYPPWLSALLIGVMAGLILYLGVRFGNLFSGWSWMSRIEFAPGVILILLGLMKTFKF
jgi:putative sporulation protein YtaF